MHNFTVFSDFNMTETMGVTDGTEYIYPPPGSNETNQCVVVFVLLDTVYFLI